MKKHYFWIIPTLFMLILTVSPLVLADKGSKPDAQGQPFDQLQEQIDALRGRLDTLENTPTVTPGQTCPAGQFVTGIGPGGQLVCAEAGNGGGVLAPPQLVFADGPFSGDPDAANAIWDSISGPLSGLLDEQQCIDAGFADCQQYFTAIFAELGVTSLVRYQISATAEPGAGLLFFPNMTCAAPDLVDEIVEYVRTYGIGPLVTELLLTSGFTLNALIDLLDAMGVFGALVTIPAAAADGNTQGDIYVLPGTVYISAKAVLGTEVSACSAALELP